MHRQVAASAQDWTQWRGPNRDGRLTGLVAPARWPARLARKWKVVVGEGHASPLIVQNGAYVFARVGENEIARRLDLATGREIWRDAYPAPYTMNPAAQGHGKGPKSTPVYADGSVYTLGISGILSCLDARSGKVRWRHDASARHKQTAPLYGTAMSPIVDHGLLIAHLGGHDDGELTALMPGAAAFAGAGPRTGRLMRPLSWSRWTACVRSSRKRRSGASVLLPTAANCCGACPSRRPSTRIPSRRSLPGTD